MMLGKLLEPIGNKIINILKINTKVFSYKLWQILRTTIFVCFGMLIFRADNLSVAASMFKSIFDIHHLESIFNGKGFLLGGLNPGDIAIIIISAIIILITSIYEEKGNSIRQKLSEQNLVFRWIILYGLIFTIIIFGIYGQGYDVQSFIYGQF